MASRPDVVEKTEKKSRPALDPGYRVIVWNDPVNLMVYVSMVFMKLFGWSRAEADKHMLEVHEHGKSVVAQDHRERAEFYVHQLHHYGLTATMEKASG